MTTVHAMASATPIASQPLPPMHRYADEGERPGVAAYATRRDGLLVEFVDGSVYLYNRDCPGRRHVERMTALAGEGHGLATYINRHVGKRFAARLR